MSITAEKIFNELKQISIQDSNVVDLGMVSHISINQGRVGFALEVSEGRPQDYEPTRKQCVSAVEKLSGVEDVTVVITQARKPETNTPERKSIPGVKRILAVASGKGGVGKSTVAVQLAKLLAKSSTVGLLDADIYGPSIPLMLGSHDKPTINDENKMVPLEAEGIQFISIGNLVDAEKATIWRGAMATKALFQLFQGTAWNNVDTLIVDMPPGTGDIHLSIAKNYAIDAAILVSTPHELALADVKKGADMFEKVKIPVLGVIENMSYFEDSHGQKHHVFGKSKTEAFAKKYGYRFLGEIPISQDQEVSCTALDCYNNALQKWNSLY